MAFSALRIAASFAAQGVADKVPGLSVGALDYMYYESYGELFIVQEDEIKLEDALAQYKADLLAAKYVSISADEDGEYFLSEHGELKLYVLNYYGLAIGVAITYIKTPENATTATVMCELLQALYGDTYTWEDFLGYNIPKAQENDGWYAFLKYTSSGSQEKFPNYIDAFEYYYLPSYFLPNGDAFELTYEDAPAIERDYVSSDGKIAVRAIFNLWGSNLYLDMYVSWVVAA